MFGNINRITASRVHATTQQEAQRKANIHMDRLAKRYSDRATIASSGWRDGAFTSEIAYKGQDAEITCAINESTIDVQLTIPLIAIPFRSKIEQRLDSEITKVLAIK